MSRAKYARMTKPVRLLRAIHLPVGPDVRGILTISIIAMLVWFVASRISHFVLPYRLHTTVARMDTIEETWTGYATAFRQESVVHSPASGRLKFLVHDGQRVSQGDVVCEVNLAGELGALPKDREKIDEMIKEAEADVRAARRDGAHKRSVLSEQLEAVKNDVRDLQSSGRLEESRKAEGEQRSLETRLRAVAAAEAEAVLQADMRRQELLRQREILLGGSKSDIYLVRAASAGVVSFQLDGLEGVLTLDTPLHDVSTIKYEGNPVIRQDQERVTAGAPLFRLVNNYHFYLYVAVEGSGELQQGEIVQVTMQEQKKKTEQKLQMRVARVEIRPDKVLALLAADEFNSELLNLRNLEIRVSHGSREGIVVPQTSIVNNKYGKPGVFVMVERTPVFFPVKLGSGNHTHVIIDGVPLGARVVTNPRVLAKDI